MENTKNYEISFLGEFEDSILEKEFIEQDIQRYIKTIGPIALIFGSIYMMFGISDYLVMGFSISFITILIIRLAFLLASIGLFLMARKIKHYIYMIYMITAYEIFAIIGFLIIANQHESLTILSFFSVIVITLAIYIIPNKLLYSQIASILLSISFFMIYAKNIEGMDLSVLWKIFSYNVIIIIYCNISAYITGFYKRKQFIYSKELLRVSVTDPLTGIYNRGKFNEELNFWIDYYNRYENSLSIVLIDIDDFKKVNDIYGHIVGDRVIQSIVNTIKKSVRNTDIFARWGGEEFVLLLPNTDMQQAKEMMERLRINIQNNRHDKVDRITCSFGLAVFRQNDNAESLLQRVDKLLYKAKKTGKNIVVYEFK